MQSQDRLKLVCTCLSPALHILQHCVDKTNVMQYIIYELNSSFECDLIFLSLSLVFSRERCVDPCKTVNCPILRMAYILV